MLLFPFVTDTKKSIQLINRNAPQVVAGGAGVDLGAAVALSAGAVLLKAARGDIVG